MSELRRKKVCAFCKIEGPPVTFRGRFCTLCDMAFPDWVKEFTLAYNDAMVRTALARSQENGG